MKIGTLEIVVIVIVALFVIGPDNLSSYAKKFGEVLKSLRAATADLSKDVQENIVEPLNEAQRPSLHSLTTIIRSRQSCRYKQSHNTYQIYVIVI